MKKHAVSVPVTLAILAASLPALAGGHAPAPPPAPVTQVISLNGDLGPLPDVEPKEMSLEIPLPPGWHALGPDKLPPPLLATGTQALIQSPDVAALILLANLRPEPRLASAQAAAMCPMLARESRTKLTRATVVTVSDRIAYCGFDAEDGMTWRVTVLHLGPNGDTQLRLVSMWQSDGKATAESAAKVTQGIVLAP